MRRRKVTAALLSVFALSILGAPMAQAQSDTAEKKCAPGQHGNKQPGFKPGVCR
jgi:hypothetical protein